MEPCSGKWLGGGAGSLTEFWTYSSSEFPRDAAVSLLSDILEVGSVPQRYFLSPKACAGILRRAELRGKRLPEQLRAALEAAIEGTGETTLPPKATSRTNRSNPKAGDPCHSLAAGAHAPAIAFPANLSGTQCASRPNLSPALGAMNPTAVAASAVRRLMPVECERLMGLEDGFTAWGIDDDGRRVELKDGPRYKIIGNGVGKPHTKWIGGRAAADLLECGKYIQAVNA